MPTGNWISNRYRSRPGRTFRFRWLASPPSANWSRRRGWRRKNRGQRGWIRRGTPESLQSLDIWGKFHRHRFGIARFRSGRSCNRFDPISDRTSLLAPWKLWIGRVLVQNRRRWNALLGRSPARLFLCSCLLWWKFESSPMFLFLPFCQ